MRPCPSTRRVAAHDAQTKRALQTFQCFNLARLLHPDIIRSMRSRPSDVAVALVLLTCLVCPVVEMFDHWDHTLQTGNDTEYTFVVLALCVGAVYALAKLIVTLCPSLSAANFISTVCCAKDSLFPLIGPTAFAALSESHPLNLRI